MRLDAVDEELVRQIRAMLYLGRRYRRSPGYYREAGAALLHLRSDRPKDLWTNILKEHCGLGPRRAYQLIELAKATKTPAQLRSENAARVRKHRKSKWLKPTIRRRKAPKSRV